MTVITEKNPLPIKVVDTYGATPSARSKLISWLPELSGYSKLEQNGSIVAYAPAAAPYNPDGSSRAYNFTVPGRTAATSGCNMATKIVGSTVGIRYRKTSSCPEEFSLIIDGVSYACKGRLTEGNGAVPSGFGFTDLYGEVIVEGLANITHDVTLSVPASLTAGQDFTLVLLGFLVEESAGYIEFPRKGNYSNETNVPITTSASIVYTSYITGSVNLRIVRAIVYRNTTASPVVITITLANGAAISFTVPASSSYTHTFPVGIPFDNNVKHVAGSGATGDVKYITYGDL